ncbi:MAG: 6-phosphofructokinase [Verrucomicrobiaceae bacterium]|nr:6-phosphofructokinase [Verrucomicrobiaceae bacterium]
MRIGILNSGGDCPGLNAVIHGAVSTAANLGWEVIGFLEGFEGLLKDGDEGHMVLDPNRTIGIMKLGGTILGTTNKGNFVAKIGENGVSQVPQVTVDQAKANLKRLGIEALIVVGGDGSLTTALQLQDQGINIIGVPKTIDNDLAATAMTFGFDSAYSAVVDALDRLHTTAESHKRVMVLEVMGRHAGWIALYGGMAGGADAILLPEIPFRMEHLARFIKERESANRRSSLVVVAEGAHWETGELVAKEDRGTKGQVLLGGIGDRVAKVIQELTGKETRACTLGHLQRGGTPTALDRILGLRFGVKAVELIQTKEYGHMVSYQQYHVGSVPIIEAVAKLRTVDPKGEMVKTARAVGICFGDC